MIVCNDIHLEGYNPSGRANFAQLFFSPLNHTQTKGLKVKLSRRDHINYTLKILMVIGF
jgi:hypothetical protein